MVRLSKLCDGFNLHTTKSAAFTKQIDCLRYSVNNFLTYGFDKNRSILQRPNLLFANMAKWRSWNIFRLKNNFNSRCIMTLILGSNVPAFLNFRRLQVKDFTSQVILKPLILERSNVFWYQLEVMKKGHFIFCYRYHLSNKI